MKLEDVAIRLEELACRASMPALTFSYSGFFHDFFLTQ